MSTFTEKKIGIFGDSHVQRLQLPENVVALGKGEREPAIGGITQMS